MTDVHRKDDKAADPKADPKVETKAEAKEGEELEHHMDEESIPEPAPSNPDSWQGAALAQKHREENSPAKSGKEAKDEAHRKELEPDEAVPTSRSRR